MYATDEGQYHNEFEWLAIHKECTGDNSTGITVENISSLVKSCSVSAA